MRARCIVIVNAAAGIEHDPSLADRLTAMFAAHGAVAELVLAQSGQEIIDCARAAAARTPDAVIAGGGDGTVGAVASMLVGTDIPLGVLPLGTLNHFSKDMGIPPVLDAAVHTIVHGRVKRIDVGEVNQRIFLNNSSLGLYPDIVRERQKQQRRLGRGKWLSFAWATLATLRLYPFLHVRMKMPQAQLLPPVAQTQPLPPVAQTEALLPGIRTATPLPVSRTEEWTPTQPCQAPGQPSNEVRMCKTPFVFIGNNAYLMEGFRIGARNALDAGVLSVYLAQRTGRWGLLRLAVHALFGRIDQVKDFSALSTKEMRIESRHRRLRVATDGEVTVMATPLLYKIRAGALQVIVPDENVTTDPGAG